MIKKIKTEEMDYEKRLVMMLQLKLELLIKTSYAGILKLLDL